MRSTSFAILSLFLIGVSIADAENFPVRRIEIELECPDAPPEIHLVFNDDETHRITATKTSAHTWTWLETKQKTLTFSDQKPVHASVQFAGNRTYCRRADNYKNETLFFSFKCSSVPFPNFLISTKPPLTVEYARVVGKDPTDAQSLPCIETATFFSAIPQKLFGYWEINEKVLLYFANRRTPALPLAELIHDEQGLIRANTIDRNAVQTKWIVRYSAETNRLPSLVDMKPFDDVRFQSLTAEPVAK
jgi:hypothetical protein